MWEDKDTRTFYDDRGIGGRVGYGNHPAVLVIDMQVGLDDPSFKVGADQTPAVEAIATLLPQARERGGPVIFARTGYRPDGRDGGLFLKKIPALIELQLGSRAVEIDPRLGPEESDVVIDKKFASAFFQTHLSSLLVAEGIDTLILTGCSTSGCIRATAIDGISHGYRMILPEECISDRAEGPHRANLFDISVKYGDVVPLDEVLEYLQGLPADAEERRAVALTQGRGEPREVGDRTAGDSGGDD